MTDNSRKTPPLETTRRSAHAQSQDDRDAEGFAARKEREAAVPTVECAFEEVTGRYEGEELEAHRSRRPTVDRIKRLEKKHDETKDDVKEVRKDVKELSGHVANLREDVAGAVGKLDGQKSVLSEMLGIVKKSADREHATFTAKVEVDKAQELAKVDVGKAQGLAKVDVDKAQELDTVDARGIRRKTIAKVIGGIFSGGVLIELLHRLGAL